MTLVVSRCFGQVQSANDIEWGDNVCLNNAQTTTQKRPKNKLQWFLQHQEKPKTMQAGKALEMNDTCSPRVFV